MPTLDPITAQRIGAALGLMDQALKQFGDAFNASDCNQDKAADYMQAEGRKLLHTAFQDAPELIGWLPEIYAEHENPNIFRYKDDAAVRQAHERLAAESGGPPPVWPDVLRS